MSDESADPSRDESGSYKPVADLLFGYLYNIIYKPENASLDIKQLPETFRDLGKGLQFLSNSISETRVLAKELARGNLNCDLPKSDNEIASSLKMLHSSLRHLTWQTQQVAKGDYNQRINFMGDFSMAFNNMIELLEKRRKTAIEEKTKLELYMQQILENCPNPILLFGSQGNLSYASNSLFRYCKKATDSDILGKHIHEVLTHIATGKSLYEIEQLYNNVLFEKRMCETDQEIDFGDPDFHGHFKIQIMPLLDKDGNTEGIIMFLSDMTENIARLEAEHARELAERSSYSKSNFLANMSHEIRTPMNAILGMAELALREEISPLVQDHIFSIRQAGINLLSIINDILDFSKIEAGKLEIIPVEYLLSTLVTDVINIIRTRMLESCLRFVVNLDSNIPDTLFGDTIRIRQVLLNLLSNAVKYTEKGFVSLSISGKMTDNNNVCLTMEVTDSGKGIKSEEMKNLFKEFIRIDQVNNKGIEGTGLGLSITRNLVKAMGGEISVRSEYGKGSTFTITLPQEVRSDQKLAVVKNPEEKNVLVYERREIYVNSIVDTMKSLGVNFRIVSNSSEFYDCFLSNKYSFVVLSSTLYENVKKEHSELKSGAKFALIVEFGEVIILERSISIITVPVFSIPVANFLNGVLGSAGSSSGIGAITRFVMPDAKILVVDDITSNLKVAAGLLLPYNAEVKLCANGMDAIEAVKSTHFDVVFMDHMMPDMDGIEALSRIRELGGEDPYYKNVVVVALTADAVFGTREMLLEKGFNDFLSKPIDTLKLNTILERWIPKEKQKTPGETTPPPESAVPGDNSDKKIVINGLDVKRGLALTGGRMKNYIEILHSFSHDGIEKIQQLKECLESYNLSLYVIYVHALKSASAMVGAEKLSQAAEELEKAGRQGYSVYIRANNAVLTAELETFLHEINAVLSGEEKKNRVSFTDKELLKTGLSKLKQALNTYNSLEINKSADLLHDFTRAADVGDSVRTILEKRLTGEYDEAVSLIDSLIQSI